MKVTMKQLFGLWGKTYKEIGQLLSISESTVQKRVKVNSGWSLAEVVAILQWIERDTGIHIDPSQIKA